MIIKKIYQSEFRLLKEQVIDVAGIDPSGEISEINRKFAAQAERSFYDAKKWFMAAFKDTVDHSLSVPEQKILILVEI